MTFPLIEYTLSLKNKVNVFNFINYTSNSVHALSFLLCVKYAINLKFHTTYFINNGFSPLYFL